MPSSVSYQKVGDIANALSFLSAFIYALAVVRGWNRFDPVWKENGFCVANPDKDFWTSHDLCFYFDSFVCGIMGILYFRLRNTADGMKDANEFLTTNAVAHFIHGLAHGYIGKSIREGLMADPAASHLNDLRDGTMPQSRVMLVVLFFGVFWISFVRAIMSSGSWKRIVVVAMIVAAIHLRVPRKFGFVFVQTALFVLSSANEILLPTAKKGLEYAVVPVFVGFPSTLVAWAEATMCTRGVMQLGGHLMYDGFLGVSIAVTYIFIWLNHQQVPAPEAKKKAA